MKTKTHKNRYGDVFSFTPTEDGNILWEGNFKYCRMGFPNDYTKAYDTYVQDGGELELEQFINELYRYNDIHGKYVGPNELSQKYGLLVESLHDKINMVDPSGGPYISAGMKSEHIHPEVEGKVVKEFLPIDDGYVIVLS
jgi:hypothetical protein